MSNKEIKNLTEKQAYLAMLMFLEQYFHQTQSDDIGALLGSMSFLEDENTADPAMWHDWQKCIQLSLEQDFDGKLVIYQLSK